LAKLIRRGHPKRGTCACKKYKRNWAWWFMPLDPALKRLRQEDIKFKVIVGYIVSSRPAWVT
jgi:hypothetical protein